MTTNVETIVKSTTANSGLPIFGFIVWWDIKGVKINRDDLVRIYSDNGLDEKHIPKRNFRSAFIRAINELKEKRIIRPVKEDGMLLVYQFTTETVRSVDGEDSELTYDKEATVKIDKEAYAAFGDISKSIECSSSEIKSKVIDHFNNELSVYTSTDITRYTQSTFKSVADIVRLRDQGSIYFVPARFESVVNSTKSIFDSISNVSGRATFNSMPIVDTANVRKSIGDSVTDEINTEIASLIDDSIKVPVDANERWFKVRRERLEAVVRRLAYYSDIMADGESKFSNSIKSLSERLGNRSIEV